MFRFLPCAILLIFSLSVSLSAQTVNLPSECKKILDKKFRGWKMAEIRRDIAEYFKTVAPTYHLNLVKGDWNGDGLVDYAVLIEHGKYSVDDMENRRLVIPFLRTRSGYRHFVFDGGEYIVLMKKGSKDYSYPAQKNFCYRTDAIFDGYFERGGVSYIWNKTNFKVIVTSD